MCGILAIYGKHGKPDVSQETVLGMLGELRRRGPDEERIYRDNNVILGHTRLSIIDLRTGSQPIFNEDKSVACILNGEIYNYRELRRDLERAGHTFSTSSDTEVIAHLYEEKGEDIFRHLNGMFAAVIYDGRRDVLLVGRDRMGEKPVVYYESPEGFICASEIKALLRNRAIPREIDYDAIAIYLNAVYIPAPLTIYKWIKKLEPAHYLVVTREGTYKRKYWSPQVSADRTWSEDDVVHQLRETLKESVRQKLVSDVPLGVFLSGGVDSSSVVALMARESGRAVKTFSVGFGLENDELPYAKMVARQYHTDHQELHVDLNIRDTLLTVASYFDEPFGDSSSVPTYLISREARRYVKVVLSGEGGDELFAGYEAYLWQRHYSHSRLISAALRRIIPACRFLGGDRWIDRLYPYQSSRGALRHWLGMRGMFDERELSRLCQWSFANPGDAFDRSHWLPFHDQDPLSVAYQHDHNYYLPDDLLKKVDMASMANGFECRAPFLDHRLVELAMKIPPEMKVKHGQTKYLLKKALEPYLPPEILYRKKRGFGAPVGTWLRGDLRDLVASISTEGWRVGDFLDEKEVLRIRDDAYLDNGDWRAPHRLWTLLMLELWCRQYA